MWTAAAVELLAHPEWIERHAEGFDQHIPKGYIYFAMAFSVAVEMLNIRMRRRSRRPRRAAATAPRAEKAS